MNHLLPISGRLLTSFGKDAEISIYYNSSSILTHPKSLGPLVSGNTFPHSIPKTLTSKDSSYLSLYQS